MPTSVSAWRRIMVFDLLICCRPVKLWMVECRWGSSLTENAAAIVGERMISRLIDKPASISNTSVEHRHTGNPKTCGYVRKRIQLPGGSYAWVSDYAYSIGNEWDTDPGSREAHLAFWIPAYNPPKRASVNCWAHHFKEMFFLWPGSSPDIWVAPLPGRRPEGPVFMHAKSS